MSVPGPEKRFEWLRLFNECANGTISEADQDALAALLRDDPHARELWYAFHDMEAGLAEWASRPAGEPPMPAPIAGATPSRPWWRRIGLLTIAACVAVAVIYFVLPPNPRPGEAIMIVHLESADGDDFRFAKIERPVEADDRFGANAIMRFAKPDGDRPPMTTLNDRTGKLLADPPDAIAVDEGDVRGFRVDLGRPMTIDKINTYSLPVPRLRGPQMQRFVLYGFEGDNPPKIEPSPAKNGWTTVARIDDDDKTPAERRPGPQASSIAATKGPIGRYRHLLWQTLPSPGRKRNDDTTYAQVDVYVDAAK